MIHLLHSGLVVDDYADLASLSLGVQSLVLSGISLIVSIISLFKR